MFLSRLNEISVKDTFPSFRSTGCAISQASDIGQNILHKFTEPSTIKKIIFLALLLNDHVSPRVLAAEVRRTWV